MIVFYANMNLSANPTRILMENVTSISNMILNRNLVVPERYSSRTVYFQSFYDRRSEFETSTYKLICKLP